MDLSAGQQLQLAKERFSLQDYHGAIHLLEELVDQGQAFADVYHLIGLSYELVEQPDRALDSFNEALARNPHYVEAHIHRGIVLAQLGKSDEAEDAFTAARETGGELRSGVSIMFASKLANKHAELGAAYAEANDLPHAIEQYQRALELGPSYHDIRLRLGRMLLDAGRTLEAREALAIVVEARPDMTDARAALGLACYLSGDAATARTMWEQLAKDDPDDRRAAAYLSMLERSAAS